MRTRSPLTNLLVASGTAMTAGNPNSRAVTAPCDTAPPLSVMTSVAWWDSAVQAELVVRATKMAPFGKDAKSSGPCTANPSPSTSPGLPAVAWAFHSDAQHSHPGGRARLQPSEGGRTSADRGSSRRPHRVRWPGPWRRWPPRWPGLPLRAVVGAPAASSIRVQRIRAASADTAAV